MNAINASGYGVIDLSRRTNDQAGAFAPYWTPMPAGARSVML